MCITPKPGFRRAQAIASANALSKFPLSVSHEATVEQEVVPPRMSLVILLLG